MTGLIDVWRSFGRTPLINFKAILASFTFLKDKGCLQAHQSYP